MSPTFALTCSGATLLVALWAYHTQARKVLRRTAWKPALTLYPSLTVIRPIRGLDAGVEENLRVALDNGYQGEVETLFVFDDPSEPAVSLARKAISDHRRRRGAGEARILFCGSPPPGRTGKLNAMITGMKHAKGELLAFVDSDTRPGPDALHALVATLVGSPRAGAAFAPVVIDQKPRTVGDAGYALLLNAMYGPAAASVARRHGGSLPFIMGQFMVLRREAIQAIGGLESAEGQLVDDMYLGARLKSVGYENRISPVPVAIIQENLPLAQFVSIYVRWITFSRSGLPGLSFRLPAAFPGIVFWLGLTAASAGMVEGEVWAAGLNALAPLGVGWSLNRLHGLIGGAELDLKHRWVAAGVLLSAPVVYLSIFLHRQVSWRGRSYQLDVQSRLASSHGDHYASPNLV